MKKTSRFSWLRHSAVALTLTGTMLLGMFPVSAVEKEILDGTNAQDFSMHATTFSASAEAESVRTSDFNKGWQFKLGDDQQFSTQKFDDSSWRKLDLPHDWSIEQPFTNQVSSEIGHLAGGTGWYRKHFTLPAEYADKRISIDFDGVYMDSHIYVNGQKVGNYPNGYMPFSFDITKYLTCDGVTDNVIAVKVTNVTTPGQQSSRWYSGSGIYRDVHMTVTDPVHVAQFGTAIYTPNLEQEVGGNVTVDVTTQVKNEGEQDANVTVRSTILNYDGTPAYEPATSEAKTIPAGDKAAVKQTVTAANPKLWSVDEPNLYLMKTEVLVDDQVRDTYETRFGFKYAKFDREEGFSLNGQHMKLNGVCMHHDQGALGAVGNATAIRRQMEIMKDMGVNAIRITHNPASPELLRACDELGLMAIEEAFDTWYGTKNPNDYGRYFEKACTHPDGKGATWAQFDLQQMIRRSQNYPCIIMWSLGNEIGQTNDVKALETVKNLKKWAKEVDPHHPVTMGEDKFRTNTPGATSLDRTNFIKVANELDVVGMNYAEHFKGYHDQWRAKYPDWKFYNSETSSAIKSRGYYSDPNKTSGAQNAGDYQLSSYDNSCVGWGATATDSWIVNRDRKWVAGEFIWTGFDYIGEPTPWNQNMNAKPKSSYFGIVDTAGFPKDDYYLYQSQWLNVKTDPMVHIFPHWNWEDASLRNKVTVNGKIPVRVYSNAPTVDLLVNGESRGEQSFYRTKAGFQQQSENSDRLYLEWQLPWEYAVGTKIEAVAKNADGQEIARDVVVTAGAPAKLDAQARTNVIKADGYDLAYITVDVQDAAGNFVPTAMNEINFRITGNGKIVGVDNGNAASWEPYKCAEGQWKRSAFNGKALVIVQSTEEAGSFTLTASAPGMEASTVTVYTTKEAVEGDTILGYESENRTTDVGKVPQMPETVMAIYADGRKEPVKVQWEDVKAEDLSVPARVTVHGKTESGADVTMTILVRSQDGVQPVSITTAVGVVPTLPETVTVIWTDGKTEQKHVTWNKQITKEDVAEPRQFTIEGKVEGSELKATAVVNVKEATEGNVALATNGTTVQVSYKEGSHRPEHLIDDNFSAENGWGNWQQGGRFSDYAILNFADTYTIEKVNVWINELSGKTWQKPDGIQIQYWNGSEFVNVDNPSKTSDFVGQTNGNDTTYKGNEITFTPVETSKLKVIFTINGNRYQPNKDMMKIKEIQVFGTMVQKENSAKLSELKVNGQPIEKFDPNVFNYFMTCEYGQKVPEVTAKAAGLATIFVRQAISTEDMAEVTVLSEDGKTENHYTIQFSRQAPQLNQVEVVVPDQVTANQKVVLSAKATLQDNTDVPMDKASVTYELTSGAEYAQIKNGELYPYEAGNVTITATVSYKGKTVTSAPKTVTIQAGAAVEIESFQPVTVKTAPKAEPKMPATVTANYTNGGLSREVAVEWEPIAAEQYETQNTFTVQGTVAGTALKATATVQVVDAVAVETVSVAVAEGFKPDLPEKVTVYFSDGTTDKLPVTWNPDGTGYVTFAGREIPVPVQTRTAESTQSPNYVIERNGYQIPVGLSAYTNDGPDSNDRVAYLIDGKVSFETNGPKSIWCDWKKTNLRTENWISATIADEGIPVAKQVNQISVGFMDEQNASAGIRVPQKYYVEYYTGPLDYKMDLTKPGHVEDWGADHPLNQADNWHEVKYIGEKPAVPGRADKTMLHVEFEPVKTHLVRVRMEAVPNFCLGVNELQVFGEIPTPYKDFVIENIMVGGVDRKAEFTDNVLTVKLKAGEAFPEVTAQANNNAAVTVVPATEQNPITLVRFVPESGLETAIQEFRIHFERAEAPHVHQLKFVPEVQPTETATGMKAHYVCTACGKLFLDQEGKQEVSAADLVIPKLEPVEPEQPDKPVEPDHPVKPDYPVHPNHPVKPEKPETTPGTSFVDVPMNEWFYDAVEYVSANGLMSGVGNGQFAPHAATTRGMIVTVLHRMEQKPAAGAPDFDDVAADAWYADAVGWASENGVVTGYGNGKFGPEDQITREQLAAILYRFAKQKGCDMTASKELSSFADAASVSSYAQSAMEWAVAEGLINGMDGALAPQGRATRAQVAAILMRFCENILK